MRKRRLEGREREIKYFTNTYAASLEVVVFNQQTKAGEPRSGEGNEEAIDEGAFGRNGGGEGAENCGKSRENGRVNS